MEAGFLRRRLKKRAGLPGGFAFFYLLLLLNSGCLERHYQYKMNLDGSCDFTYQARGDSADIYDPVGSYPEAPFFKIKTWSETDTAGKVTQVLEANASYTADSIPATLGLREVPWTSILLQHPARFNRKAFFFFNTYKFALTFQGRDRNGIEGDRWKYIPEECRALENGEDSLLSQAERAVLEEKYAAGMLLWNVERYKLRFQEIIQRAMQLHSKTKVSQAWVDSAMTELDTLLDALFHSVQMQATRGLDKINLEWWDALEPQANRILTQNLNIMGDSALAAEVLRVADLLELRHQVSKDLLDESFEIRVDLPGRITKSNAPTMDKGVLVWKYLGEDMQESDVALEASSLYLYPGRITVAIGLLVIGFLVWRFRKARPPEVMDQPPPPPPPRKHSGNG